MMRNVLLLFSLILCCLPLITRGQDLSHGDGYYEGMEFVKRGFKISINERTKSLVIKEGEQSFDYRIVVKSKGKGARKKAWTHYGVVLNHHYYVITLISMDKLIQVCVYDTDGVEMRNYLSSDKTY